MVVRWSSFDQRLLLLLNILVVRLCGWRRWKLLLRLIVVVKSS